MGRETLSKRNINQVGNSIVEGSVNLPPLSLENTVRLFAILTPSLPNLESKESFIEIIIGSIPMQRVLTVFSGDIAEKTVRLFALFKDGLSHNIIVQRLDSL